MMARAGNVGAPGDTDTNRPSIYPSLANKTVLITGGGSGIGGAFTRAFALQNARVAFVDIAEQASRTLVDQIRAESGTTALFLRCDIREIDALRSAIEKVRAELGDIGVLINNAASDDRHAFDQVTPSYWDDRIAVNLRHMFFATQAVLPQMKRLGGGAIINLGSIIWRLKHTGLPAYGVSKASVTGLTRTLAREFGPFGIRVNTLSPGAVWTERQMKLWYTPEFEKEVMAGQCLPTRVLPEDIANMALFLASDAGAKCSAQDFIVDAGWS
jgi:NAD(P)-dependent dehydrogenase (short-subunit alcohol dehydrogenase family)